MSSKEPTSDQELLHAVLDEFAARLRRGEHPQIADYERNYPQLATELREILSAVMLVEDIGGKDAACDEDPVAPPGVLANYQLAEEIGRGGMGTVYAALDRSLGRTVALKVLNQRSGNRPDAVERFRREARAAARLRHPHIVPVYDYGSADGCHFIAMQLIAGHGLDRVIQELRERSMGHSTRAPRDIPVDPKTDRLPSTAVLAAGSAVTEPGRTTSWMNMARIAAEAAEALQAAHEQEVIHRDIKPSNILLDADGRSWVSDFGLARLQSDDSLTETGDLVGTLRYMAPERLRGWADPRSDVYGLGLTLYELLTLSPAFADTDRAVLLQRIVHDDPLPPRRQNPAIPRDLETIVLKAAAKEPLQRYQSAAELAADLRRFCEGKPVLARRTALHEQFWLWCRRNPGVAVMSALLALSLVGGTAALAWNLGSLRVANHQLKQQNLALQAAEATAQLRTAESAERLQDAMQAIDQFLVQAADHHLSRFPGTQETQEEMLNTALMFYGKYLASQTDDQQLNYETAEVWLKVGQIRDALGQGEAALAAVDSGRVLAAALQETGPQPDSAVLLAKMLTFRAKLGQQSGDRLRARQDCEDAVSLLRETMKTYQAALVRRQIAVTLGRSGLLARSERQPDDARAMLEESISLFESLRGESPPGKTPDTELVSLLAASRGNLANVLAEQQQFDEAVALQRASLQDVEQLAALQPSKPAWKESVASSCGNLAATLARAGRLEQAREHAVRGAAVAEELVQQNPGINEYASLAVNNFMLQSAVESQLGVPNAEQTRLRALPLAESLVERQPEHLHYRLILAGLHSDHATWLMSTQQDHTAAVERLKRCHELVKDVLKQDPAHAQARYLQSISSHNRALCLERLGQLEEALQFIETAIESGGQPQLQMDYLAIRLHLLARLQRTTVVLDALPSLEDSMLKPGSALRAAAAAAISAANVEQDPGRSDEDRLSTVTSLRNRALSLLKLMEQRGALKSAQTLQALRSDPEFDSIRQDPAFQEILAASESQSLPEQN